MSVLTDLVESFRGKSADEIAQTIARRKIRGRMGTTAKCPLALLFRGTTTGEYVIGRRFIVRRSGNNIEKVRTPRELSVFVRRFDIGKYPELIAPPPRCIHKPLKSHHSSGSQSKSRRKPITHHLAKLVGRFDQQATG